MKMYKLRGGHLPVNSPAVLGQELFAGRFQGIIWTEIADCHGDPCDWVDAGLLDVFGDSDTVEAGAGWDNDGVMHDLKGNAVDEKIRNNLLC